MTCKQCDDFSCKYRWKSTACPYTTKYIKVISMENKNLFEGAKFGDKFVTRDGKKVIFLYYDYETEPHSYNCWIENVGHYNYNSIGKNFDYSGDSCTDIVSRYQESIDENKLDELAKNREFNDLYNGVNHNPVDISYIEGFKAGYKKAMED